MLIHNLKSRFNHALVTITDGIFAVGGELNGSYVTQVCQIFLKAKLFYN